MKTKKQILVEVQKLQRDSLDKHCDMKIDVSHFRDSYEIEVCIYPLTEDNELIHDEDDIAVNRISVRNDDPDEEWESFLAEIKDYLRTIK